MNRNHRNSFKLQVFSGIALFLASLFFVPTAWSLDLSRKKKSTERALYITVTKKDRCPVCGMFVHPYQNGLPRFNLRTVPITVLMG